MSNDLKHTLRPLIKECVKEVIFEEGFLSGIVAEVLIGVQAAGATPIVEHAAPQPQRTSFQEPDDAAIRQHEEERRRKIQHTRQQMAEAIGRDAYNGANLFEGTEPLARGATTDKTEASPGALSGVDPNAPGVDLSAVFGASQKWNKMV